MTEFENLRLQQRRAHRGTPSDAVDGILYDAVGSPPRLPSPLLPSTGICVHLVSSEY